MYIIIHAGQKDGLVTQRDAGTGQLVTGFGQLLGDFIRMVDMNIHPQRVELLQHVAQIIGDALGHEDRHAGSDADDLDMRDLAQPGQDLLQDLGRQDKRVTTREQHIPYLGGVFEIIDLHVELVPRERLGWVADDTRPRAVTAIGGALGGNQHQHPIRVAMDQSRHGGMFILG